MAAPSATVITVTSNNKKQTNNIRNCKCIHCNPITPPNGGSIRRNESVPKCPINKNLEHIFVDNTTLSFSQMLEMNKILDYLAHFVKF